MSLSGDRVRRLGPHGQVPVAGKLTAGSLRKGAMVSRWFPMLCGGLDNPVVVLFKGWHCISSLGKTPTSSGRRLISLRDSIGLFECNLAPCAAGSLVTFIRSAIAVHTACNGPNRCCTHWA